jgi:hypothetical protein
MSDYGDESPLDNHRYCLTIIGFLLDKIGKPVKITQAEIDEFADKELCVISSCDGPGKPLVLRVDKWANQQN